MTTWRNWAGNQRCHPQRLARPTRDDEVAAIVRAAAGRRRPLRVVGAGHSFTGLVPTDGVLVDVGRMTGLLALDPATGLATFGAGTTLAAASADLAAHGRAFENLGDIAVQTIAGAIGTATHGTGAAFGNLSSTVVGARLVTGSGEVLDLDGDDGALRAVRVSLGALGILTRVTIATVRAFTLEADEAIERVDDVLRDVDGFVDDNDHAEFFWFPGSDLALVKRNRRSNATEQPRNRMTRFLVDEVVSNAFIGAVVHASDRVPAATRALHALLRRVPPSRYIERSDHVFASPRRVRFVEMELSVPRAAFAEAFARLRGLLEDDGRPVPLPVECRFVAGDDADLSPAHGGARAYLAFHLSPRAADPARFDAIAAKLDDLGVRPHWGKVHPYTAAELAPRYPRWEAFQAVRRRFDPHGIFTNPHLASVLGPVDGEVPA